MHHQLLPQNNTTNHHYSREFESLRGHHTPREFIFCILGLFLKQMHDSYCVRSRPRSYVWIFFGVIYYYFSEFNRETERTPACSSRGASACCDFAYLFSFSAPLEYLFDLLLMFFGAVLQSTVS
jgi:hypothetical protein